MKVYSDFAKTALVEESKQSGISMRLGEMQTQGPEGMRSEHRETKGRPSLLALPEGGAHGVGWGCRWKAQPTQRARWIDRGLGDARECGIKAIGSPWWWGRVPHSLVQELRIDNVWGHLCRWGLSAMLRMAILPSIPSSLSLFLPPSSLPPSFSLSLSLILGMEHRLYALYHWNTPTVITFLDASKKKKTSWNLEL